MKLSKGFLIAVIVVIVIGLAVWAAVYWKGQKVAVTPTPTPAPVTTESQLEGAEADLKEVDTMETDLDTSDLEGMEKDLDTSQFDVL